MIKVILRSFGAFPIFDNLVSRKWLAAERNGMKFGPQEGVFSVYRVLSIVKWFFPIFNNLVSRKRQVLERNIHLNLFVMSSRHQSPWASCLQMTLKTGQSVPTARAETENLHLTGKGTSIPLFSAFNIESLKQRLDNNQKQELKRMRDFIKEHGLRKLKEYMEEEEARRKNTPLNIAVIGRSGVGKSSFINTIRGLRPTDPGATAVGITQTTLNPTPFPDPSHPNLVYWDLPGVGTPQYPVKKYKEQISFDRYDFFLILSFNRFTDDDAWLALEAKKAEKPCFFVRTKVDVDLRSEKEDFEDSYNEEISLKKVSRNIEDNLKECGVHVPVFLISCKLGCKDEWNDFPRLSMKLIEEFPQFKRDAMICAMTATGREVIDSKYELLKKDISRWAVFSGIAGMMPVLGADALFDITLLQEKITHCLIQFGIDRLSLERLSGQFKIPLPALLRELQVQCGEVTPRNIAMEALGFGGNLKIFTMVGDGVSKTIGCLYNSPFFTGIFSYFYMYCRMEELLTKLRQAAINIQNLVWVKSKQPGKLYQDDTEVASKEDTEKEKNEEEEKIQIPDAELAACEKGMLAIIVDGITELLKT